MYALPSWHHLSFRIHLHFYFPVNFFCYHLVAIDPFSLTFLSIFSFIACFPLVLFHFYFPVHSFFYCLIAIGSFSLTVLSVFTHFASFPLIHFHFLLSRPFLLPLPVCHWFIFSSHRPNVRLVPYLIMQLLGVGSSLSHFFYYFPFWAEDVTLFWG